MTERCMLIRAGDESEGKTGVRYAAGVSAASGGRPRRSTVAARATSSLGLNGLIT